MKLTKAFPAGIALILTLAACTALPPKGTPALKAGNSTAALATAVPGRLPIQDAARNFAQVISRVEPIAESLFRSQPGLRNCDFQIWVDTDAELPPNAYQTLDQSGRPQIVFTLALIAEARNPDELAFVLGHETAHHIEGHLAETRQEATNAAIIGGLLASASGPVTAPSNAPRKSAPRSEPFAFPKDTNWRRTVWAPSSPIRPASTRFSAPAFSRACPTQEMGFWAATRAMRKGKPS